MCCTSRPVSDMIENKNSENVIELFCTSSCMMASKIQAISASGTARSTWKDLQCTGCKTCPVELLSFSFSCSTGVTLNCDNCSKMTKPACHLAMSDASIRHFCTLTCAMSFKVINSPQSTNMQRVYDHLFVFISLNIPRIHELNFDKLQEKLLCAQCGHIIKSPPKVIQAKVRLLFNQFIWKCFMNCFSHLILLS